MGENSKFQLHNLLLLKGLEKITHTHIKSQSLLSVVVVVVVWFELILMIRNRPPFFPSPRFLMIWFIPLSWGNSDSWKKKALPNVHIGKKGLDV